MSNESIDLRAAFAEFTGMAIFVYLGTGSAMSTAGDEHEGHLLIALTFGFAIATLVYAFGHISGGHFNPCVTLSLCLLGKCDPNQALMNFFAQMMGAIAGSGMIVGSVPDNWPSGNYGANELAEGVPSQKAFYMEGVLTFLLITVVLQTAVDSKADAGNAAPLAIGLAVFLAHAIAIPFDGCSINPARSFGPAVVANTWEDHWVFWAGPIAGSIVAVLFHRFMFESDAPNPNVVSRV